VRAAALALLCAGLASALLAPRPAAGQSVVVQAPRGPQYLGAPIEIRVIAEGFDDDPEPEASVAPPERGRLELAGVHPNVSQSISIIDGRISRSKRTQFIYLYRYLAMEAGEVEIGPFTVKQGSVSRQTQSVRMRLQPVPTSDRLRVELRVPEEPRYVGERIPLMLEFWLEAGLQDNLRSYSLRAPLFELRDDFQFLDDPGSPGDTDVTLETASGKLRLRGSIRQASAGGQRFLVVSVERTLVPLRAGRYALEPATLLVEEATSWTRDFLGGRRPTRGRKLQAVDRARVLDIKALPRDSQPASFAGAVGRGFTLEVSADRTVVQVGDPIALSLTLRGEGNLATAGLPPLDAEGLLPDAQFQVPEGDLAGELEAGAKRFTAVVRVREGGTREIPARSSSWFDPDTGSYATTRSRPIALSVRPAEVIAADDVFSAGAAGEADAPAQAEPRPEGGPGDAGGGLALTGADLAIERDVATLLSDGGDVVGGRWLAGGLYTGASLLLLAALWDRRRRDVDPQVLRRRRLLDREHRRVRDAVGLPADEALTELAGALRRMLAEVPDARSAELDALLGECDARSYAPAGRRRSEPVDPDLLERARVLAERLAEAGG
jgi:hypothetical protein